MKSAASYIWKTPLRDVVAGFKRRLGRVQEAQSESIKFICCLSTGRVGTQTLAELGRLCLGSSSVHEPAPYLYGLGRVAYQHQAPTPCTIAAVECCRESLATQTANRSGMYLETSPQVTFLAPAIKSVFPHARFIHVIRHPVDVVRSGMRRGWYNGNPRDRWRITPVAGPEVDQWNSYDAFEKNVWSWSATNQWALNFTASLDPADVLLIKSEDLFAGRDDAIQAFFRFLGDSDVPEHRIEKVLKQKLNAQGSGQFPNVNDWSQEQQDTLMRHAGALMQKFGYTI